MAYEITSDWSRTLNPHPDLFYIRASRLQKIEDTYDYICNHSYNPDIYKISFGRANIPGQQICYFGRIRCTSLFEVRMPDKAKDLGKVGYSLSRWVPQKTMQLAAILNPDTLEEIDCGEMPGFLEYVKRRYTEEKNSENAGLIHLYKYLSVKFTEVIPDHETFKYKLTSAFSNFVYGHCRDISGLMYQSVQSSKEYNLALMKDTIDKEYFEPSHFFKEVYEYKNNNVSLIFEQTAKSFDKTSGKIFW